MKRKILATAVAVVGLFVADHALAQGTLGGTSATSAGTLGGPATGLPSSTATSAGSPQTAGPMNSAPNGAGGSYGYPNSNVDPNTVNSGATGSNPANYGGPYYNYGGGTTSGTTTSVNPSGAPFVAPPASSAGGSTMPISPATSGGTLGH